MAAMQVELRELETVDVQNFELNAQNLNNNSIIWQKTVHLRLY
jgi:hypothetical protein